jgi:hypothetical protein
MKRFIILSLILIPYLSIQSYAQGNLLITPMRVVFEGAKQIQELNLVNTGTDTTTFTISFIQYNMKEDGTMVKTDKPDEVQMPAAPYLHIYPTKVTLAPGEPQVIVLQLKRKSGMPTGEYRSHLYFRAEKENSLHGFNKSEQDTTQLTVHLIPVYGLSIPVIIRTNDVKVSTTLTGLELENPPESSPLIKFTINRTGNISTYGDIIVENRPQQGKPVQLAVIRGIGVYADLNKRKIVIRLNNSSGIPFKKGKIKVSYVSNDESKKSVLYAEGELDI